MDNIPNDSECIGDQIIETYIAKRNLDAGRVIDPSLQRKLDEIELRELQEKKALEDKRRLE